MSGKVVNDDNKTYLTLSINYIRTKLIFEGDLKKGGAFQRHLSCSCFDVKQAAEEEERKSSPVVLCSFLK